MAPSELKISGVNECAALLEAIYQLFPLTDELESECHLILNLLTLHKRVRKSPMLLPCREKTDPLCYISTFHRLFPAGIEQV